MAVLEQTLEQIADELGISRQAYHSWIRRGCPRGSVTAAQDWRDRNLLPRMGGPKSVSGQKSGTVQEAILIGQAVKLKEEGRAKKLKNDILEGQLLYRDDALQAWSIKCAEVKSDLEILGDMLVRELPPELRDNIGQLVEEKIRQTLLKWSRCDLK